MANTEQKLQHYTITAEVTFATKATSVVRAHQLFVDWMAEHFNSSFSENVKPSIAPSSYETMKIERDGYGVYDGR